MRHFLRNRWKSISVAIVACLVFSVIGVSVLIGGQVREAICLAQATEPGDPIRALLAVANSTNYSISERNTAIWSLGQLGSSRALEPLVALYTGASCPGSSDLCQYELEKAINLCRGDLNIGALIWRHGEFASR